MSVSADLIPVEVDVLLELVAQLGAGRRYVTELELVEALTDYSASSVESAIKTLKFRSLATAERHGLSRNDTRWTATSLGEALARELAAARRSRT